MADPKIPMPKGGGASISHSRQRIAPLGDAPALPDQPPVATGSNEHIGVALACKNELTKHKFMVYYK